jgi:hypothetical protein
LEKTIEQIKKEALKELEAASDSESGRGYSIFEEYFKPAKGKQTRSRKKGKPNKKNP